jgi:dipeptidyl aminopeptidase/acylaminoacyl peptidase
MDQINRQFPTRSNLVVDMTRDGDTLVIRSFSDVDDGTYYLFNREEKKLKRLGTAYPELKTESLGEMKSITYKAADGTEIPGYLTVPNGVKAENLPLIVLPHDGPAARDTWRFSFLRTFLANRGYAVLQMNYRGSSGYGQKWRDAAKQDWGGVSYSDITDATRWAVAQGIADPKRVCIAGWGFGGYAALLGAARNSDMYKCSISIGGVADLAMLRDNASTSGVASAAFLDGQIGSEKEKLARNSPADHADSIGIPVLLVHGDLDWQVQIDQSKKMASALKKQKKDHKAVFIKGAGHDLDRKSDRMTLLREVEEFLQKNL